MKFKRLMWLGLLVLLAMPTLCLADDAQNIFDKGNNLYNQKKYKEAGVAYQQLVNEGYRSAALYYNLGNVYFRTGDIPSAVLYYQKARKLSPGDVEINTNIRFANLRTDDKIEPAPEFFITRWWHDFILWMAADTLAIISVLFVLIASGAFVTYLFTNSVILKKTSFFGSIVLLVLGLVAIFMADRQTHYFENHRQAVIFSGTVNVRKTPSSAAKALFIIHNGTLVDVSGNAPGWIKIRMPNGNEGWILDSDAKGI